MIPYAILRQVYAAGSTLQLVGDRITCPTIDRLPTELRREIGEHKADILALLRTTRMGGTDRGFWLPRRYVPPPGCENEQTCARHGWCLSALARERCDGVTGTHLPPGKAN